MGNVFLLEREILTGHSTAGKLYEPDGTLICSTMEDCDRDLDADGDWKSKKVYGETAIPCGTYEIEMQMSSHFKRMMPYLKNVVTHSGVMIHSGNRPADSLGCILVGDRIAEDVVANSKATFNDKLLPVLARYLAAGDPVFIQVRKSDKVIDKRNVIK
jgi:hypothetical protein